MSLVSLDIPDDPATWPNWLERHLVGVHLRELVGELQLLAGPQPVPAPSLEELLGPALPRILEGGLQHLTEQQTRQLLRHPQLLLRLQERVLVEGGNYWQSVPLAAAHQLAVARQWNVLQSELDTMTPGAAAAFPTATHRHRFAWRFVTAVGALAAAVLIAVGLWPDRMIQPTWGFDKGGLLTAQVPASEYLQSLTGAAREWFKKTPETPAALERRLREFRHGCDTLIRAPHTQLAAADRDWLVDRCKNWSSKLDGHLADLNSGAKPFSDIRREADATINALIKALEERSRQVV